VLRLPSTPIYDHICWYDKETIANLVKRYGFKVERVEFCTRVPYGGERKVWVAALEKVVCYISWLLYQIGFREIASMNLFIKCSLNPEKSEGKCSN
jgi:hypothetical protein